MLNREMVESYAHQERSHVEPSFASSSSSSSASSSKGKEKERLMAMLDEQEVSQWEIGRVLKQHYHLHYTTITTTI